MESKVTIQGKPVIKIWESWTGWYWFATERVEPHIWFGLVRGLETEWEYWDDRELESLKPKVWELPRKVWEFCPLVEVSR
jgi:hypothetical protein